MICGNISIIFVINTVVLMSWNDLLAFPLVSVTTAFLTLALVMTWHANL